MSRISATLILLPQNKLPTSRQHWPDYTRQTSCISAMLVSLHNTNSLHICNPQNTHLQNDVFGKTSKNKNKLHLCNAGFTAQNTLDTSLQCWFHCTKQTSYISATLVSLHKTHLTHLYHAGFTAQNKLDIKSSEHQLLSILGCFLACYFVHLVEGMVVGFVDTLQDDASRRDE